MTIRSVHISLLQLGRTVLVASLLILGLPDSAIADKWVEVRSPNFTVISNASEKEARRTAYELEQIRAVFTLALKPTSGEGAPVTVIVTDDLKLIQKLIPSGEKPPRGWRLFAMDSSGPERYYMALKPFRSSGVRTSSIDLPATLPESSLTYQRYANRFVRVSYGMLPWWLEAGLARFYGTTVTLKDRIRVGAFDRNTQLFLTRQRLIPIQELVSAERGSITTADPLRLSVFQAQSAALIHYLTFGDDLGVRPPLRYVLQKVRDGMDSANAIESTVGDLNQLQRKLQSYLRRQEFLQIPVPAPSPVDLKALPLRPISAAEAAALLADFHLQEDRIQQARAFLEEASQLDPNSGLVQTLLGWLHHKEGHRDLARAGLKKALATDDKNHLALYYLSRTYSDEPSRGVEATGRAEYGFRRVLQLNPRFAPACDALAKLLAGQSQLDEAARLSRRSLELDPSVAGYYLTMSRILQQLGQSEVARHAAQQALAGSENREQREQARALLAGIPTSAITQASPAAITDIRPQLKRRSPDDVPSHPQSAEGIVQAVTCLGFEIQIVLATDNSELGLRSANFVSVEFTEQDKGTLERFEPCKRLKGLKARISFWPSNDPSVSGEIVAVAIRK